MTIVGVAEIVRVTTPNIETTKIGHKEALKPYWLPCPIERGMRILGGKWKGSILWHLKDDPVRFNELARLLVGCSKKMIYQRLVEMEGIGLIKRNVLSTSPIAVAYEITDFGRSALQVLDKLKDWAEEHEL